MMRLAGQHIHFMGVGGIGVSALAEMAMADGAIVSGCDRAENELTRKLRTRGANIFIGHDPAHLAGVDLLVHSAAVPSTHPERLAAGERQEKRGLFLTRFINHRDSIGVSGTHGKTTTSWFFTHLLVQLGADPAAFIGGIAPDLPEGNYRLGTGPFVAELDESDASFLLPRLDTAVITNIESDHLSHYRDDAHLLAAFEDYARGMERDGLLVAGVDNPAAALLYGKHRGRKLSYGLVSTADTHAEGIRSGNGGTTFKIRHRGRNIGLFTLPLPGRHNVMNVLAAAGTLLEKGYDADGLRRALGTVRGVGRRLELLGRVDGADLYSDYAHHPTEMAATIAALREKYPGKRSLVVFQPHLYSRTRDYADAFGSALAGADAAILVDIYPAREEPMPGVDSTLLLRAAKKTGAGTGVSGPLAVGQVGDEVKRRAGEFAAVVMMGAGDIDAAARDLAAWASGRR